MKRLIFLFLLVSMNISATESKYYYKAYDQKGFKATIQEIERGVNYSILEVDIINTDAQGGPFSIIAAAVEIGTDLGKTHFTLLKEFRKEKLYYYKIFFTSDINEDPSKTFPNEISQDKLDTHRKIGYLSIATYDAFSKGVKSN